MDRCGWVVLLVMCGCGASGPHASLSTFPGQSLRHEYFYGKWDLDGERTQQLAGQAGIAAIPSALEQDVMGHGWRFERNGVMWVDRTFGVAAAGWRLEPPHFLILELPNQTSPQRYVARFEDGFLYLRDVEDQMTMVFERDKFAGF